MKKLILNLPILLLALSTSAFAAPKVLMMVPDDFMWPEYSYPIESYKAAGFEVTTAGKFKDIVTPDKRNTTVGNPIYFKEAKPVKVDLSFEEVKVENFDAITFVAGNGAWHDFFPSDVVHKIVLASVEKKKILGLLCASTGLLGIVGNYDGSHGTFAAGKNVVGYYRVEGLIKMGKANYIPGGKNEPGTSVDGNLVTGRNPESAKIFGEKIVEVLKTKTIKTK